MPIRRVAVVGILGVMAACATTPVLPSLPAVPVSELSCLSDTDDVTWVRTAPPAHQATLDAWCTSVGPPWRHTGGSSGAPVNTVVVVSWNLNVGRGNLDRLFSYMQTELKDEVAGARVARVLLLQEVHRTGTAVPASSRFPGSTPRAIRPPAGAPDIVQLAQARGLSAVYVPSMRNGSGQDRGNAVLTTETLLEPRAIELPFGTQRRVAVGATIVVPSGHASVGIQVFSTHFDTGRERVPQANALAAAVSSPHATIVSGDFNSFEGRNDGTFKALAGRLSAESCGDRRTHAWPWRLELFFGGWVGRLDHIFTNLMDDDWSRECSTIPHFFGSDHRPILLVLTRAGQPI